MVKKKVSKTTTKTVGYSDALEINARKMPKQMSHWLVERDMNNQKMNVEVKGNKGFVSRTCEGIVAFFPFNGDSRRYINIVNALGGQRID